MAGDLDPREVFRTTSRCQESKCQQFRDGRCGVGEKVMATRAPAVEALPPCAIRKTCRWFEEHGVAVCTRCPQVVTVNPQAVYPSQVDSKGRRQLRVV
jgi:hypothetical protein